MRSAAVFLAASLAAPAFAIPQSKPEPVPPVSLDQLQQADEGKNVFDAAAKDKKDGVTVVAEDKDVTISRVTIPPHKECFPVQLEVQDENGDTHVVKKARMCAVVPGAEVVSKGTVQVLQPSGAKDYVRNWTLGGAGIGAGIGALGFLALLIPGIGIGAALAIGIASTIAGGAVGALIGYSASSGGVETKGRVIQTGAEGQSIGGAPPAEKPAEKSPALPSA